MNRQTSPPLQNLKCPYRTILFYKFCQHYSNHFGRKFRQLCYNMSVYVGFCDYLSGYFSKATRRSSIRSIFDRSFSLNSSLKNYLTLTDLTKDINFGKSYNGITNVYYRQYGRIACVIVAGVADKDYLAQTPYKIADAADFNIGDGWHSSVEFNTGITMRVYKLDDDIVMGFHQNILKGTNIYTHFTYIV